VECVGDFADDRPAAATPAALQSQPAPIDDFVEKGLRGLQ
jgi:hypothetical protein